MDSQSHPSLAYPSFSNDRRRRGRVKGETAGWILPSSFKLARHSPGEDEAWEVRIQDVSRYGAGFTSTQAMKVGNEVDLRIGLGPISRARLARIIFCREISAGVFFVGTEFTDLAAKELRRAG